MHILDITSYIDKEDVTYVPKVTTYVVQHTTQLTNQGPHLVGYILIVYIWVGYTD